MQTLWLAGVLRQPVESAGSTVSMEVYVFADLAPDGRFRRIEETTLMLEGSDADRSLGSAH